jgi:hypothetical protein
MGQVQVNALAQVTSTGATGGMVWCVVSPSMLQGYTGITSVGLAAMPFQAPRMDYVPSAGTNSVAVALPSCTLSVGTDGFTLAVGSTVTARYTNLSSQVTQESWTRVV